MDKSTYGAEYGLNITSQVKLVAPLLEFQALAGLMSFAGDAVLSENHSVQMLRSVHSLVFTLLSPLFRHDNAYIAVLYVKYKNRVNKCMSRKCGQQARGRREIMVK
jgi:hypothetical protein